MPARLWRVFPWDPNAAPGSRFSASFVPAGQGRGRFDLVGQPSGVLYLAESEVHAVAEMVQKYRNIPEPLTNDDLTAWGQRLALVEVTLDEPLWPEIVDLCDPAILAGVQLTADRPPMRDRNATQRIAADLFAARRSGLRWWSAFWGEWHSVVLFRDILDPNALAYGPPAPLDAADPLVRDVARLLDIG